MCSALRPVPEQERRSDALRVEQQEGAQEAERAQAERAWEQVPQRSGGPIAAQDRGGRPLCHGDTRRQPSPGINRGG